MTYALVKLVHLAAVIVWVGGMVFAHFFLRPALAVLEAPQRLQLMRAVLGRFFAAVLVAVIAALASGAWMIGALHGRVADTGGQLVMPWAWSLMTGLGLVMAIVFAHIRFLLFPRMDRAVAQAKWPAAAEALGSIRRWVVVNLVLGWVIVAAVVLG